jgi:hypothetical protein
MSVLTTYVSDYMFVATLDERMFHVSEVVSFLLQQYAAHDVDQSLGSDDI